MIDKFHGVTKQSLFKDRLADDVVDFGYVSRSERRDFVSFLRHARIIEPVRRLDRKNEVYQVIYPFAYRGLSLTDNLPEMRYAPLGRIITVVENRHIINPKVS